ncbi:Hypothetical protein SRAE_1000191050 [Strongyloides ratti]|uniref:Uncharacterized protein n=1 Tax=Strongyloides ratti TaxID=34506 RepID=A0A090L1S9_STRRB|nr:Hypothetical protein SRAE_1000191050 [Strongyloides ratti]CEF63652.1 Hypothetical protein SRAE_1000191050 [Strongyloides ratti]
MKWYYLGHNTRRHLLTCYYLTCAFGYPLYAALNWDKFIPRQIENIDEKLEKKNV